MLEPTRSPNGGLSRRLFLADLGRGAVAIAVLGIAGCSPTAGGSSPASSSASPRSSGLANSQTVGPGSSSPPGRSASSTAAMTWSRVNLGFVSAYLLARSGEIAIVDTGVSGSDDEIASALRAIGQDWGAVAHVILTHKHGDHAGSIGPVLTNASKATGYIGTRDLAAVESPRSLTGLSDGDTVFGLRVVGTPGHTVGHISVLDGETGVLVAGDALRTDTGSVAGSNPQFTEDAAAATATTAKLGNLTFETLLPGHGEPILTGAAAEVKALSGN